MVNLTRNIARFVLATVEFFQETILRINLIFLALKMTYFFLNDC